MGYTIDSDNINMKIVTNERPQYDEQGRLISNLEVTKLYADVPFIYLNQHYTHRCFIADMYSVERDLSTGVVLLPTMTVITPLATVDKTFIDAAIENALTTLCAQIDTNNLYASALTKIKNNPYAYPTDLQW